MSKIKKFFKNILQGIGTALLVIVSSFVLALIFGKTGNQAAIILLVAIFIWTLVLLFLIKFKKSKPKRANSSIPTITAPKEYESQFNDSYAEKNHISDIKYTRNDNYATAALLKWSESGKAVGNDKTDYPYYLQSTFKILDPVKYHKKLISMGYLEPADVSMSLKCLKVNELKEILKKNNLPVSGKKDDLINTIISNVNCDLLNLERFYVPSTLGMAHLKRYEYVFRLNNYGISIDFFDTLLAESDQNESPDKVILNYLSSEFVKYYDGKLYSLAGNQLYNISKLFYDQNQFETSTFFLVSYFYFCLYEYTHDDNQFAGFLNSIIGAIFDFQPYYQTRFAYECCEQYKELNNPISPIMFDKLIKDIFDDIPIDFSQYLEKR